MNRRTLDRMKLVLDVSRPSAVGDLETQLSRLGETAASLLGAEHACVYLYDPERRELWTRPPGGPEERREAATGLLAAVLSGEHAVRRPAANGDGGDPCREALAAPLRHLDRTPLGVLWVEVKREGAFSAEDAVLCELLAEQAAVGIERFRHQAAAARAAELQREMEVARTLQAALIPSTAPRLEDVEAVGWTRPASVTGGDGFDIWLLPDERLAVFLGDASGHGLPAALIISQVRTLVRSLSEIESAPEWLLSRVNARLAEDLPDGRFVTTFLATISRGGIVRWSSAGQGPVFVCRAPQARYEVMQAPAVPLGLSHELTADVTPAVTLEPGGMLVVVSDGILEARGRERELFGPVRLRKVLEECRGLSAREVADAVRARVAAWEKTEEPLDDQTVLVIRRTWPS